MVNLHENVSVSLSQFKESVGENTSLNLNEDVYCSVDDDGDSGRERRVDEWSNAYISERNGLKMKISGKENTRKTMMEIAGEKNMLMNGPMHIFPKEMG